jgi:hypothetical protein
VNPSARLSAALLLGLVLWLPTLGPCMRGDIGLPEAGVRYLVAFGFVSLALAALDRLIRAYSGVPGEDGVAMADGTDPEHLRRRDADGRFVDGMGPNGAGPR